MDGVLTDGTLHYGPSGEETKIFHVRDGLAIVAAGEVGLAIAVISGRASPAVTRRMAELGVREVHQGVADKVVVLEAMRSRLGLEPPEVAVMGDDIADLGPMERAGLSLAPADAVTEIRRAAHWTSRRPGGSGAVREAIEMLLKARGAWPPRPK